jgi:oxaloacetate decarboxylase
MTSRWSERRAKFRRILAGDRCVYPVAVHDAMSSRVAEDLGFEATMMPGSLAALSVLAAPDLTLLSLTEFAAQSYNISRAGSVPLLVDSDHGFGNALNVKRTVEELEAAGVAALSIEDTLLPAAFDAAEDWQLISLEEGVGKMKAALAGRTDPDLVIVARSSSISISGLDDAIARVQAYEKAGVDALFIAGAGSRAELEAVSQATSLPLMLGNTGLKLGDAAYLASQRVRVCLMGHQPFAAAVRAMQDCMMALRDGGPSAALPPLISGDQLKRLSREADYEAAGKAYLRR